MSDCKKLLLVGYFPEDSSVYAYAQSFIAPFKKLGFDVQIFNYRKKYCSILNNQLINHNLIRTAQLLRPDVIFFLKAETITASTIKTLKHVSSPIILYFYPDSPFSLWNDNATPHLLHAMPMIDHFLIWTHDLTPALISAGCKQVVYFPFAFDDKVFYPIEITDQEKKHYLYDVCFVGTWEPERERWLTQLCKTLPTLNLAIWGNDWAKHITSDSPLATKIKGQAIYGLQLQHIFAQSKIVLNFIRQQNIQAHNMRTFEVPACKAFLLTQWTHDQAHILFKEGESIACFSTIHDLSHKIRYYLEHESERKIIAHNGFVCAQSYTLEKQLSITFKSLNITIR